MDIFDIKNRSNQIEQELREEPNAEQAPSQVREFALGFSNLQCTFLISKLTNKSETK